MKTTQQKIEISLTRKEQQVIDALSRQCKMSNSELVRTILFDSGILSLAEGIKR